MIARKHRFTLIEVLIVVVAAAIVLLPIATMMGAAIGDWQTGRKLRLLQEEMDLAAYYYKGVLEEAHFYRSDSGYPTSSLRVFGPGGVGDYIDLERRTVQFRHWQPLELVPTFSVALDEAGSPKPWQIDVTIEAVWNEIDPGDRGSISFSVFLRNYK